MMELLFFDTFSHETNEELNLDLVQFPRPVCIYEVRIIPLGSRVQADFPGGVRLGATNPSSFAVDFFVNDLSKTGASNFAKLGSLDYKQNVTIQLSPNSDIPTDGLVLKGWYSTVTLAVFGIQTKVVKEKSPSPPPPPPPRVQAIPGSQPEIKHHDIEPVSQVKSGLDWHATRQQEHAIASIPEAHPQHTYIEPQAASTYSVNQYSQEAGFMPPATVYHDQTADYRSASADYPHAAQYPDQSWSTTSQSQDYVPSDRNLYRSDDAFNQEQKHRSRDYHRDRRSRSPSRERDSRDYKDKDSDYSDRYRSRDLDDRHSRDSHHKRGSYGRSKHQRSRSRDPTPLREKRPHSPPPPHPTSQGSSGSCPTSPHSSSFPFTVSKDIANSPTHHSRQGSPIVSPAWDGDGRSKREEGASKLKSSKDQDKKDVRSEASDIDDDENDGFEEILSEEEGMFDVDEVTDMAGDEYEGDESLNFMPNFDPYQYEIGKLSYFYHPKLTNFEVWKCKTLSSETEDFIAATKKLDELKVTLTREDRNEKWVEGIEQLSEIIIKGLFHLDDKEQSEFMDNVLDWCLYALDYDKALNQQLPLFKIRHLKAGTKLAISLFSTDSIIIEKLCIKRVPYMLLDLFVKEHMALSIKLLLLNALDVFTNCKAGMIYFCKGSDGKEQTCYQKLLDIALSNQLTRTMVAIRALLRKIHLFELLSKLKNTVSHIVLKTNRENNTNQELENSIEKLNENSVEDIIAAIVETKTILQSVGSSISQPGRSFPVGKLFEFHKVNIRNHQGLYSIFDSCHILESLCILLTSTVTAGHLGINRTIRGFLEALISTHHGIIFLLSHSSTTTILVRTLLQITDELQDIGSSDDAESQQFGLQMAYSLYTMQLVDTLFKLHSEGIISKEIENSEVISALQNLSLLTFSHVGRSAVVSVLSNANNLEAVLPFIETIGDDKWDAQLLRSATYGYASDLLLQTLRLTSSVDVLKKFSKRIFDVKMDESSSKLNEIIQWLAPTKSLQKYSVDEIEVIMNVVKNSAKDSMKITPELVTSLRILKYLCISSDVVMHKEKQEELKYKYAIIQVFAHDGLSILTALMQKICTDNLLITNDASHLIGSTGMMLLATLQPICSLIKHMLSYLIHCRATEFKDLTALPTLLEAFHFLSMISISVPQQADIQKIQKELLETLLAYTQPILSQAHETDEAIGKSLWTQMVMEVLKFIHKSPRYFVNGLNILSELLPVPLPIQTCEALTQEEITKAINIRKLWCAHLHPLSSNLHQLINSLCNTSCPILQHVLKRVCLQLADLAAPTSVTVVKAILAAFIDNASSYVDKNFEDIESSVHDQISRILNLLVSLMSNPTIKVTMLHLINVGYKTDEKTADLLSLMQNILSVKAVKSGLLQVQECVLSIFQSMCDSEITLMSSDTGLSVPAQLSSTVPPKEQLVSIFQSLVSIIGREHQDFSLHYTSILLCMRTMLLLMEHDYGFYHLKMSLEEDKEAVFVLLDQLSDHFVKELNEFIALMSTLLELLRELTSVDDDITTVVMPRTMCMSICELASLLKWEKRSKGVDASDQKVHPLLKIKNLINNYLNEDDGLEGLQDSISLLIQLLDEAVGKEESNKDELSEPILPAPDSLLNQFGARATFMIADSDDDRLNASYWFCQPNFEEAEFDSDLQVELDLLDLELKLCPNFELKTNLEKAYMPNDEFATKEDAAKKSSSSASLPRSIGKKRYQPFINPGKRDFQGGGRGRNFNRGGGSRVNDPFRSRPPNTSRPPSMHVDDFVALENNQSSNSASNSSNGNNSQNSKRSAKYKSNNGVSNSQKGMARDNTRANRNWGMEHQFASSSSRARFFNGSPYDRRENNRINTSSMRANNRQNNNRVARSGSKNPPSRPVSRTNHEPRQRDMYPANWGKLRPGNAHWMDSPGRFNSGNGRNRREGNGRHNRTTTR